MNAETVKRLRDPEAAYRGKPFWSWNGALEEKELLRQIDCMREMGFGGFFMHSRTGLITEYLGEEWFRLIRRCAEYGAAQGMEAWLYDEDRWPSGTCGGTVTFAKENRLRFVSEYDGDEEAAACEDVVGVLARYALRYAQEGERYAAENSDGAAAANELLAGLLMCWANALAGNTADVVLSETEGNLYYYINLPMEKGFLYQAAYDPSGALSGFVQQELTEQLPLETGMLEALPASDGEQVKTFLWDEQLQPLAPAAGH